ncbi:MAG: hypothetical protein AABX66_00550 [Nanoarchaeota archaeon]
MGFNKMGEGNFWDGFLEILLWIAFLVLGVLFVLSLKKFVGW